MKPKCLKSALKCNSFDVAIGTKFSFFRVLVTIEPGRSLLLIFYESILLVKIYVTYKLAYVKNFLLSYFYYTYERVRPLVSTSLFTLNLKFCPNSLRMTPELQKP